MKNSSSHLRVTFPMWQGGNDPAYKFGAELLTWLAPDTPSAKVTIPVATPSAPLEVENGITGRSQITTQLKKAEEIIANNAPDTLAILGGDCLADLVPFAWLSNKYKDGFGILWIDTHPDVMTPEQFSNSHAHVLGALMGMGDSELTAHVKTPVPTSKVMIAGIHGENAYETEFLKKHNINICSPEEAAEGTEKLQAWIAQEKITHLAIHFDLDVLNTETFKSLIFMNPDVDPNIFDGIARGKMSIEDVINWISKAEEITHVVGVGITEYFAWDAMKLRDVLNKISLMKK